MTKSVQRGWQLGLTVGVVILLLFRCQSPYGEDSLILDVPDAEAVQPSDDEGIGSTHAEGEPEDFMIVGEFLRDGDVIVEYPVWVSADRQRATVMIDAEVTHLTRDASEPAKGGGDHSFFKADDLLIEVWFPKVDAGGVIREDGRARITAIEGGTVEAATDQ